MNRLPFLALFSAISLVACDQAPIDGTDLAAAQASGTQTVPAASAAQAPIAEQRIADLEAKMAEMSKQMQACQKLGVATDGTLTITGNVRVDGAVGINMEPVAGTALMASGANDGIYAKGGNHGVLASGATYGLFGTSDTGVGVYGSGGNIGLQAKGGVYGLLTDGTTYGIYSFGTGYSFYGTSGTLHNVGPMDAPGGE